MMRLSAQRKGLTLVELMVTIAIFAIIGTAMFTGLTLGMKTYNMNMNGSMDQLNLRDASIKISRSVRNAPSGTVSVSGSTLTVNGLAYTIDSAAKTLKYNGSVIANNISAFTPTINSGILTVSLTSKGGTTVSTELTIR